MTTSPDPLTGLFPTGRELTDYSGDPDFALCPVLKPGRPDAVAYALSRLARMEQNR